MQKARATCFASSSRTCSKLSTITFATFALLSSVSVAQPTQWQFRTVDPFGVAPEIALDHDGRPHAVYRFGESGVRWAQQRSAGGSWSPLRDPFSASRHVTIRRDGEPAIGGPNFGLAYRVGGNWIFDRDYVIDDRDAIDKGVAFDAMNRPHAAFIRTGLGTLEYARWNGTAYDRRTVAASSALTNQGADVGFALNQQDLPYFAWQDVRPGGSYDVRVAIPTGADASRTWTPAQETALGLSMAVDERSRVHLTYVQGAARDAYYRLFDGVEWREPRLIDSGVWDVPTIDADAHGTPHVVYARIAGSAGNDIVYARPHGDGWARHALYTGNSHSPTIGVDRRGAVHVLLNQGTELHHAFLPGASGGIEQALVPALTARATTTDGATFALDPSAPGVNAGSITLRRADDGTEVRGVMEFDLSAIPVDALIYEARLELHKTAFPSVLLFAYRGDGDADAEDASEIARMIGGGDSSSTGTIPVSLDPAMVQSLRDSGDYLGFVATVLYDGETPAFAGLQNDAGLPAPRLVITYVPEPGAVLTIGVAGCIVALRPRRRANVIASHRVARGKVLP